MDQRFDRYGQAVCQYIRHATGREKQAIQAELSAHMEDHAQALADAGYPKTYARQLAVEAMGDPEEIGRELDRAYPRIWLVFPWAAAVVVVALALLLAFILPGSLTAMQEAVQTNLQARSDPASRGDLGTSAPLTTPMDRCFSLPGGTVLVFYGTSLDREDTGYTAYVYTVRYHQNPLSLYCGSETPLTFSSGEQTLPEGQVWQDGWRSTCYQCYAIGNLSPGASLTARYDYFGTVFSLELPLNWEEVTP